MKKLLSILIAICLTASSFASIVVVNGLSHEHTLTGTQKAQGNVVIRNTGEKIKRAKVYKTDVYHYCTGETNFDEAVNRDRCSAKWTTISDNELILQPGQTFTLTYALNPPESLEKSGSYWAVIMVEEMEDLDTTLPNAGVKVNALVRYAIQIIGNYEKEAIKQLDILDVSLDTSKGYNQVKVSIQNPGNILMKPIMILEIYDTDGSQIARKEIPYQKIYPGFCKLFEIPITDVPSGKYEAILVADCGDENIYGLKLELEVNEMTQKL